MEKFDVIIVGAGPSGLKAAEVLGNAGKKVFPLSSSRLLISELRLI